MKITPKKVENLKKNEIFVFGSNGNGDHAGGAARLAVEKFGAQMGNPLGLQGQSFAIPTLDTDMKKVSLENLKNDIDLLATSLNLYPKKFFILTEIGCGIAGFTPTEIAPLFKDIFISSPANISFPESFIKILTAFSVVSGFKGFDKGMKCRTMQYAENQEFSFDGEPSLCNYGLHFCENPLDVFGYYPPEIGREYAQVEATGKIKKGDDKTVTNKLRIQTKISLGNLFKLHFGMIYDRVKKEISDTKVNTDIANTAGNYAHANTAGNYAHANTAGYKAHANTAGNYAHANTAGESAHANTAGYKAHANTAGYKAHANTAGYKAHANTAESYAHANTAENYAHANTAGNYAIANTAGNYAHANTAGESAHANTAGNYAIANTAGNYAHANTAGESAHANTAGSYAHANTAGNYAHANTAGESAHANTAGYKAHANTAGYKAHANTAGESAHANTAGSYAHANTAGNYAIACAIGIESKVSAKNGWIVLTDWRYENKAWAIVNIHTCKTGKKLKGILIEPTKRYWFENGELKSETI